MIYKGIQKEGKVYKGGTKIGKIYKGSQLVYQNISSIKEYTLADRDSATIALNPIIPLNKKFKIDLISQTATNYYLMVINSQGTQGETIYRYTDNTNRYGQIITNSLDNFVYIQMLNAGTSVITVKVRVTIY